MSNPLLLSSESSLPIRVVFLPGLLIREELALSTVVVLDVLRATTSISAALASDVQEVRIFGDVSSARSAQREFEGSSLLCGEVGCLPPVGFDLGNSPSSFRRELHSNQTVFLSTTNGTVAIIAARSAALILIGALVNATQIARAIKRANRPAILLCAGTQGDISTEDILGAGAILNALIVDEAGFAANDSANIALQLFRSNHGTLKQALSMTTAAIKIKAVGLESDIETCAAVDSIPVVGVVYDHPLRVCRAERDPERRSDLSSSSETISPG